MSSPSGVKSVLLAIVALCGAAAATPSLAGDQKTLRVCADPNNLPYSDEAHHGFENRIAEVVARQIGAHLEYIWWAQRGEYLRNTIEKGLCDALIGVPAAFQPLLTTRPYYRSGYMFVTRKDETPALASLDDPRLRALRVGVQLISDEASSPPAHALADRGMTQNVRGFLVYGDYGQPEPIAPIVRAVASGAIDVALVWGPQAGYFATRQTVPLVIAPIPPERDTRARPMAFDISIGVRPGNRDLRQQLDEALVARRDDIARVLDTYHIPRLDSGGKLIGGAP